MTAGEIIAWIVVLAVAPLAARAADRFYRDDISDCPAFVKRSAVGLNVGWGFALAALVLSAAGVFGWETADRPGDTSAALAIGLWAVAIGNFLICNWRDGE